MNKKRTISLIGGILIVLVATLLFVGWRMYKTEISLLLPPGPLKPPLSERWFFENSHVISYVEVLEVDREIKESAEPPKDVDSLSSPESTEVIEFFPPLGEITIFPKQHAKVKFLKILKGPKELRDTASRIVKGKTNSYLKEGERLVLYLRKPLPFFSYRVVGPFEGEWRLTSALANVNTLKKDRGSGIVVGVLNKRNLEDLEVHILQGRHKAPVVLASETYRDNFTKKEEIDEFDIAEIPLEPGAYTILIKLNGSLYSFNRLVEEHYPYVVLEENNWRSLYFDVKRIEQNI